MISDDNYVKHVNSLITGERLGVKVILFVVIDALLVFMLVRSILFDHGSEYLLTYGDEENLVGMVVETVVRATFAVTIVLGMLTLAVIGLIDSIKAFVNRKENKR